MKLVVLDGYTENPGDLSWEALRAFGEVTIYERTSYVDAPIIAERLQDADIAVVNKTPITKQTLDACPHLKLICVLATGYNVVDCACAKEKGIPVCNVPAYGTIAVLATGYNVVDYNYAKEKGIPVMQRARPTAPPPSASSPSHCCSRSAITSVTTASLSTPGNWASNKDWCYWDYPLIELEGKTIGIIGFGRIGQAEGRTAKALGMNVLAYDLYPNESGKAIGEYVDLDTLFAKADVITLHCNLTPENTGMINKASIAKMKDGVILHQQRPRPADRRAGRRRCSELRQDRSRRLGRGLHRADPGRQPPAQG